MQWKEALKSTLYRALKRPVLEQGLQQLYGVSPKTAQSYLAKVFPQPTSYTKGERRVVVRHGLRWHLEPAEFCQWYHYYQLEDPVLTMLASLVPAGGVVFDIGANVGLYALSLTELAKPAHVYAIEAHPRTFARLEEHIELNRMSNITAVARALGDRAGHIRLHEHDAGDSGMTSVLSRPGVEGEGVEVAMSTLDDLTTELGISRLDVIKLDVEGFEPEVILGGRKVLERYRPALAIELTPKWSAGRQASLEEAGDVLRSLGYKMFAMRSNGRGASLVPMPDRWTTWDAGEQYNVFTFPDRRPR